MLVDHRLRCQAIEVLMEIRKFFFDVIYSLTGGKLMKSLPRLTDLRTFTHREAQ